MAWAYVMEADIVVKGRGSASSVSAVMLLAFGILSFRVAAWVIYRSELAYITNDGYVIARIFQMLVVVLLMVSMRNRIPSKRVFIGGMVLATVATVVASAAVIFGSNGVLPPSWGMAACGLHGAASAFSFLDGECVRASSRLLGPLCHYPSHLFCSA